MGPASALKHKILAPARVRVLGYTGEWSDLAMQILYSYIQLLFWGSSGCLAMPGTFPQW